ncbi:hypothetical protein E4U59_002177 [Claviceps monticola]|nr:hypothetical protein E4U59_002177 [Claviceps monticola]
MALVARPNTNAIPERLSLVIVSNPCALVNSWLPKAPEKTTGVKRNKEQSASVKRRQGLQFIISALQKLAATKNCAVVVLSQCATKMQSEHGATLVPAVNTAAWNQGISTRIVIFRDWACHDGAMVSVHLAGVQKLDGKSNNDAIEHVASFCVDPADCRSAEYNTANMTAEPAITIQRKRKRDDASLEVPDTEDDEDYGWADEDESALPQPPQWQGSEDILLGQELGRSDEERDDDSPSYSVQHSVLSSTKVSKLGRGAHRAGDTSICYCEPFLQINASPTIGPWPWICKAEPQEENAGFEIRQWKDEWPSKWIMIGRKRFGRPF